ncbi:MAG: YggT family protein [Nitriliruptorales bacterium]|nr:YggT family protein [Nitriliruptorales bacterium]
MTGVVCWLLFAYMLVLLTHVIFSWVPAPPEELRRLQTAVGRLVEPVAGPLRRALPPVRLGNVALDLSIIVLFFGLIILRALICI